MTGSSRAARTAGSIPNRTPVSALPSNAAANYKIDNSSTGNPTTGGGTTDINTLIYTDTVVRTFTLSPPAFFVIVPSPLVSYAGPPMNVNA